MDQFYQGANLSPLGQMRSVFHPARDQQARFLCYFEIKSTGLPPSYGKQRSNDLYVEKIRFTLYVLQQI